MLPQRGRIAREIEKEKLEEKKENVLIAIRYPLVQ